MEQTVENTTSAQQPLIPNSKILEVKDGQVKLRLTQGAAGKSFRQPVEFWVPLQLSKADQAVYQYMKDSLVSIVPRLIPFAYQNHSIIKLAKYLLRHRTGSKGTAYQYIYGAWRYSEWLGKSPDQLVTACFDQEGIANPKALSIAANELDEYLGQLQAEGLAPKTIALRVKAIKALYMTNCVNLTLPYKLSSQAASYNRSPKPEELQSLIDLADLRDKVIVSMLALGGFRVGTLAKLRYYHVKDDLERGVAPIHIHVEAQITKGKYGDYDTFIGKEATDYLKAYLDTRRRGSPSGKIPPETITDMSPLIRDVRYRQPHLTSASRIHRTVHNLYIRAGMLKTKRGQRYELCVHSLRKYFRTQMAALGVNTDYINYMMGHIGDTYHDIEMKGVEFLRNIYTCSGLSIRPRTQLSRIDALKEIIRAWGLEPEKILTREAMMEPHRTEISGDETQIQALSNALKEMMRKELLKPNQTV
jgi:integrase